MRKLNENEKRLLAIANDNYVIYECSEHGLFLKLKTTDNKKCPFSECKGTVSLFENTNLS